MEWLHNFHFIRPAWLLLLLPALAAVYFFRHRRQSSGQWQQVIDPDLLPYVLDGQMTGVNKYAPWVTASMLVAAFVTAIALAGPAWQKVPQPVAKNQDALVILLDMSLSMGSKDLPPSRAVRAIQKVTDIVRTRQDGQTALIVYAAGAYTVTPLTDDTDTIENLLPSISPFIMPAPGSRPDKAIEQAQQLISDAGISQARLLLITDGIQEKDIERIDAVLNPALSELKILAVGTPEGAPVPMPGAGFLKDGNGNIVMPGLDTGPISALAEQLNIPWQRMTLDDSDWQSLLSQQAITTADNNQTQRRFDLWKDQGYWLILLLIPPALLLFRRGVVFSILLLPLLWPQPGYALEWQDLWQTKDQQAAQIMEKDPAAAAGTFEDPEWKGSAAYRAGDYETAAKAFAQGEASASNHYNRGNALANAGNLEGAIEEYQKALDMDPDLSAAAKNLETVKKIQQQQRQQQNQDSDSQHNSDKQQQDGQQQKGQQSNNQQNQSQQNNGQQQNGQQNQDAQQQQNANEQSDATDPSTDQQQNAAQKNDQDGGESSDQAASSQQQKQDDGQQDDKTSAASAQDADKTAQDNDPLSANGQHDDGLSREERAAMQQWLNRVPDEPGNLLQRKFLYQYRQQDNQESGEVLW